MSREFFDVVAILTTTVLPIDGIYRVETLDDVPMIQKGTPHYIGHPATAGIVEKMLGATRAPSNLFLGLLPGESALVVSIKQGRSSRKTEGKTVDQDVTIDDLSFRILSRIDNG